MIKLKKTKKNNSCNNVNNENYIDNESVNKKLYKY